MYLAKL